MTDLIKLTTINFDFMENHNPEYVSNKKYFTRNDVLSAREVCAKYLATLCTMPYLGYDDEVYPKFKVEEIRVEKLNE
jgi:hypothetical protein